MVEALRVTSPPERWEDLDPDFRDMVLRVGQGELTADEAKKQLQQGKDD